MKKRRRLKPELDSAAIALGNGWITVYLLGNRLDRDLAGCLVDEVETE